MTTFPYKEDSNLSHFPLNLFVSIWHLVHGTPMSRLVRITNKSGESSANFKLQSGFIQSSVGLYNSTGKQIGVYQAAIMTASESS